MSSFIASKRQEPVASCSPFTSTHSRTRKAEIISLPVLHENNATYVGNVNALKKFHEEFLGEKAGEREVCFIVRYQVTIKWL